VDERDDATDETNDGGEASAPARPAAAATPTARESAAGPGPSPSPSTEGGAEPSVLPPQQVRAILEALVFASPQPITPREIARVLGGVPKEDWQRALGELQAEFAGDDRGLQLIEVAGGWQITTRPEYNDWVRELLDPKAPTRLSIQALETLAVIAYKQPVTLPEIIELRGVKSGGVVKTLLEKRLIRIMGRKEVVGRPILYGTTTQFLLHFGLRDLAELPKIEEFAEVLGEEVDVAGLKKAIESPRPVEVPLSDEAGGRIVIPDGEGDGTAGGGLADEGMGDSGTEDPGDDEHRR
jgi:segregation and condensation protein B